MSTADLRWCSLAWPSSVEQGDLASVLRVLAASASSPAILEAWATGGLVRHRIGLRKGLESVFIRQLRASITGLRVEVVDRTAPVLDRAVRVWPSNRRRPLQSVDPAEVSRALLTALAGVGPHETLILQWLLGAPLRPAVVPSATGNPDQGWIDALLLQALDGGRPVDAEARQARRAKQATAGWRMIGRIAVRAAGVSRQRQLIGATLSVLRTVESPGVRWKVRNARVTAVATVGLPLWLPGALNSNELVTVSTWPVGETRDLPIVRRVSRVFPPSAALARSGRIVGVATWSGAEHTVALGANDALRHLHVLGPTGTGKSTMLLNLIAADIAAGSGVVVIDPKGDLVTEVLARIPSNRIDDVVVVDPSDPIAPVGLNPLSRSGRSPDVAADQLLAVFRELFAAYWGPRTQDILHAGLLTLCRAGDMSLAALPLLLTDANFRRRVLAGIDDPLGVGAFWMSFASWSEAERTTNVAPALSRLRPFLMRPQLRAMLGQAAPRWSLREVFTRRRVVLVNLAKGLLGAETANLIGGLIVTELWHHATARAGIEQSRRHPVFVYADEFQDYLHFRSDIEDALATSRSLVVGWVLAHQHLDQLPHSVRAAVLSNARSRVAFQLGIDDARALSRGDAQLKHEDFQGLPAFEAYARLVADGAVQPWCSIRSLPAPPIMSDPERLRARSRERFGRPIRETEEALNRMATAGRAVDEDDLNPRKRRGGSP